MLVSRSKQSELLITYALAGTDMLLRFVIDGKWR